MGETYPTVKILLPGIVVLLLLATGCDAGSVGSPTEAPSTAGPSLSTTTTAGPSTTAAPERSLVEGGCSRFGGAELGVLTGLAVPLSLIQDDAGPTVVRCSFVGTAEDVDANVRIEVVPVGSRSPGYWTTPGQGESPVSFADIAGVGTGRGSLRLELPGVGGVTLSVTIRALTDDAPSLRDGEHLAVRDDVARYVIDRLR